MYEYICVFKVVSLSLNYVGFSYFFYKGLSYILLIKKHNINSKINMSTKVN